MITITFQFSQTFLAFLGSRICSRCVDFCDPVFQRGDCRGGVHSTARSKSPGRELSKFQGKGDVETDETRNGRDGTRERGGDLIDSEEHQCAICLETDSRVQRLCDNGHYFHSRCLSMWNQQSPTCPICRKGIPLIYTQDNFSIIFGDVIVITDNVWPKESFTYQQFISIFVLREKRTAYLTFLDTRNAMRNLKLTSSPENLIKISRFIRSKIHD